MLCCSIFPNFMIGLGFLNLLCLSLALCNHYPFSAVPVDQDSLNRLLSCFTSTIHSAWEFQLLTSDGGRRFLVLYAALYVIILNAAVDIHLCLGSGTSAVLDLTSCSPDVVICLEWSILPDLHWTLNYHVNVHFWTPCPINSRHPNWIVKCAD
jgi:hypothetical protein